ncbi:unnamed protein product [Closterium sp. Yama58-4]|nr:unnamed protein product [Closterium sp. Yama58-4]
MAERETDGAMVSRLDAEHDGADGGAVGRGAKDVGSARGAVDADDGDAAAGAGAGAAADDDDDDEIPDAVPLPGRLKATRRASGTGRMARRRRRGSRGEQRARGGADHDHHGVPGSRQDHPGEPYPVAVARAAHRRDSQRLWRPPGH